ncbi:MAG TPA: cytochrome D1 domain-containing protein [Burkholderiales bacterium]|nr:cytochrome D1 domain-containing protein [Burkholderiales bacterium]
MSKIRIAVAAALLLALPALAAQAESEGTRHAKDGLVIDFAARAVEPDKSSLREGDLAEVRFSIREEATGKPVRGLSPGAWLDIGEVIQGQPGAEQKSCKEKIALYLRGIVGIRPLVDLNSYYVVVMNQDASLSVVDPTVSMVGRTSTLAKVLLAKPGADFARSLDDRHIFVTMPLAGQVAVVEADSFKVVKNVRAGEAPTRAVLQPDGRYLWVGNNAGDKGNSGVTVIDTATLEPVKYLPTGAGHHEIALSDDSRWAFVGNRGAGTVSVIDVRTLERVRDLEIGGQPISLAFSALAKRLYVVDAKGGAVLAIRPGDFDTVARIAAKPGLGPMRFTPDGRWALVANTSEDRVLVIDPSTNRVQHEIAVQGQPYQIAFTRAFAYVRALGSERVTLINLSTLGAGKQPTVQSFAAGSVPPKAAGGLVIADSIAGVPGEAGVMVVNPADDTTYFYMEGMNAAASNYKTFGARARAVTVVDRSLREIEPGVYAGRAKLPAAGRYDVAFSLDTPRLMHCFSAQVAADPVLAAGRKGVEVDYEVASRQVQAGKPLRVRFRIYDGASGAPKAGLGDVRVMTLRAPGRRLGTVEAREVGQGVYEAEVAIGAPGAYYIYVSSAALGKEFAELPYLSLAAQSGAGAPPRP